MYTSDDAGHRGASLSERLVALVLCLLVIRSLSPVCLSCQLCYRSEEVRPILDNSRLPRPIVLVLLFSCVDELFLSRTFSLSGPDSLLIQPRIQRKARCPCTSQKFCTRKQDLSTTWSIRSCRSLTDTCGRCTIYTAARA